MPTGYPLGSIRWRFAVVLCGALTVAACDREAPSGDTVVAGPDEAETAVDRSSWDGARIYDEVCDRCHKMGVDGAPEPGDREAWAPRIAQGRAVLLRHIRQGYREMPERGDCAFCTDAQLASALDYMLERSR